MSKLIRPADQWSPLYFLASVGAGGVAVSFFMWLYMWIPHKGQPVPIFEDIAAAWAQGVPLTQAMIVMALAGILGFAALNLRLLIWNIGAMSRFKASEAHKALMKTNAESQYLAFPLAIAMSINVGFILGLVFVPGLWGIVEYLFPLALSAFVLTGLYAFTLIGRFLGRILGEGGFNWAANNNFGQVVPAFALGMIGVGLSAPAALSLNPVTAGTAITLATVFLIIAGIYAVVSVVLGLVSMAQHGANAESAPTLMIVVPLMTVLGILMLRVDHGLHVHFEGHTGKADSLLLLTQFLGVQVTFLLLGWAVLARQGYGKRFLSGSERHVGSYALVCPGVALSVMLQFWINKGLVGAGLIEKFSAAYWSLSALAVVSQLSMVVLVLVLNRRHFGSMPQAAVPAE